MIIVQTPLRLSFLGGGTDFEDYYKIHGGAVLSTAINKNVYIIVKERFDDYIYINYSKKEIVDDVSKLEHGLVREAMKLTNVEKGIEITTLADVPAEGTGLGSSSSITVGLLHALYTYRGEIVTQRTLADQACHIEIERLHKPIGRQDQYIAAFGNMRFISFNEKGIDIEYIQLASELKRKLESSLMLFYTGITRKADDVLSEQKDNIYRNSKMLEDLNGLAFEAKKLLLQGDLDGFGEAIHRGWMLKRGFASRVTNSSIDGIYETARKAGAIGGKITGAGGGGFLLLYCPVEKQKAVRAALGHLRELPFRFQDDGSKVIFNYRMGS
jgi:D-glycero-alpha-D-manno-heptose-7-phosphate kinase